MVIVEKFIHIRSHKFPILPSEQDECVNDGMYGKALALYLQEKLILRCYDSPFVNCEDWGWQVELKNAPTPFGVCVYSNPDQDIPTEYACIIGANRSRKWNWSKFKFVDVTPWADKLHDDLMSIFNEDNEIEVVGVALEFPF